MVQSRHSAPDEVPNSSQWFDLGVRLLSTDRLGEEFVADVLNAHEAAGEPSRKALADALRSALKGKVVGQDLRLIILMVRHFGQRGGFLKYVQPKPRLVRWFAQCWAEIHADEMARVIACIPALQSDYAAAERLLRGDPSQQLSGLFKSEKLLPRKGLLAACAFCIQRAYTGIPAFPASSASTLDTTATENLGAATGGSMNISNDESANDPEKDGTQPEPGRTAGSEEVRFEDQALREAWTAMTASPSESSLWDEGERFVAAARALVELKLAERASVVKQLPVAIEKLNTESAGTLEFLGLAALPVVHAVPSATASDLLGMLPVLRGLLDECESLRGLVSLQPNFETLRVYFDQINDLKIRAIDLHGRFTAVVSGFAAPTTPSGDHPEDAGDSDGRAGIAEENPADIVVEENGGEPVPPPAVEQTLVTGLEPRQESVVNAVEATQPEPVPSAPPRDQVPNGPAAIPLKIDLTRLQQRMAAQVADSNIILCLDFGTARSKAFATTRVGGETIDLPLAIGLVSKTNERAAFSVGSSVWIDEQHGRIYFGERAITRSQLARRPGHQRIDSFKSRLSLAELVDNELRDPAAKLLDERLNPTTVQFTEGDILLLFLGFLTWTAEEALRQHPSGSKDGYVRRRFALPSWEEAKRAAGTALLEGYLSRAQLIADAVGSAWAEGLPIYEAKALVDSVFRVKREELPIHLLDGGVLEPIAAGATRIELKEPQRRLVMIVDVGAGTTDYALFFVWEDPDAGFFRFMPRAVHTWNRAGNRLDDILRVILLDKIGHESPAERDSFSEQIIDRQRDYKETLFNTGAVSIVLGDGAHQVSLTRDDFLKDVRVVEFSKKLEDEFDVTLVKAGIDSKSRYAHEVLLVVLTGGGAHLPMVKALGCGRSRLHGAPRQQAPLLPENVPAAIAKEYLQLAVAWGGAMPELPQLRGPIGDPAPPVGPPGSDVVVPGSSNWRNEPH